MLKFPIIINVIFIDHALDARQYASFCFFFLMLHEIGIIIIPADVETETKATNT